MPSNYVPHRKRFGKQTQMVSIYVFMNPLVRSLVKGCANNCSYAWKSIPLGKIWLKHHNIICRLIDVRICIMNIEYWLYNENAYTGDDGLDIKMEWIWGSDVDNLKKIYIDGLVQGCSNSIADALKILQFAFSHRYMAVLRKCSICHKVRTRFRYALHMYMVGHVVMKPGWGIGVHSIET